MIPSEIRRELGLKKHSNVTRTLNEFLKRGIAICLNAESNKGHLYQLTPKGIQVRNRISSKKEAPIPEIKTLSGIEPNLYSWIVRGKARRAVALALEGMMTTNAVRKEAKNYDKELSEFNNIMTLRSLSRKGLVISKYDKKLGRVVYRLTSKAVLLKQLLRY